MKLHVIKLLLTAVCLILPLTSYAQTAYEYFRTAFAKDSVGNYKGAIEDYTKAITIDPRFADAYANRGLARHNSGDVRGALDDLNTALGIDSTMTYVYFNRANVKMEMGY